jgi:hypothetical protein
MVNKTIGYQLYSAVLGQLHGVSITEETLALKTLISDSIRLYSGIEYLLPPDHLSIEELAEEVWDWTRNNVNNTRALFLHQNNGIFNSTHT